MQIDCAESDAELRDIFDDDKGGGGSGLLLLETGYRILKFGPSNYSAPFTE